MEKQRRIFLLRHGERVDHLFGKHWMDKCFDLEGEYKRTNLNMPKTIPKFKNRYNFAHDPPLTQFGEFQASIVGEGFADQHIKIDQVFCSPSFRCVQTALAVLRSSKQISTPISFEFGLTDPNIIGSNHPDFSSNEEIKSLGLNVQMDYKSIISWKEFLNEPQNLTIYLKRFRKVLNEIYNRTKDKGNNILIVTHGSGFALNGIRSLKPNCRLPTKEEILFIGQYIPYCVLMEVERNEKSYPEENQWKIIENDLFNYKHFEKRSFNYNVFISKFLDLFN